MKDGSRRTVRVSAQAAADDVKEHDSTSLCDTFGCPYIVEEHQVFDKPETGEVPEFTIEVAYKTKDIAGNQAAVPGWRYLLKWLENGQHRSIRGYGFQSKESALAQARIEADDVARALAPVHVETYRPEV